MESFAYFSVKLPYVAAGFVSIGLADGLVPTRQKAPWSVVTCGSRPSLVQIMACHLVVAKPLSEPILEYCKLDPQEQTSMKF